MFFLIVTVGLLAFWIVSVSKSLSDCFAQVSQKYEDFPALFLSGSIKSEEFERQTNNYRLEKYQCEEKIFSKYWIPKKPVDQLRELANKIMEKK